MPLLRGMADAKYWLLAYLLFILLPAGTWLYVYYQKSSTILEAEVTHSMLQTVKQAGINLQYQMDRVQDTSNALFMNPYLYAYLADSNTEYPIDEMKNLSALIASAETNDNLARVRLFVDESKLYAGERVNFFSIGSLQSRPWYKRVLEAGGSVVWTGAYEEKYLGRDPETIFSSARLLRDLKVYDKLVGVLVIDMKEQTVRDMMSRVELSGRKKLFIVDADGAIIWHQDKTRLGSAGLSPERMASLAASPEGIAKSDSGSEAEYAIYTTIRDTGWKLIAEVPADEISRQALTLNKFTGAATLLGGTILFLLLAFALLAFVIRGMNRRVLQVIRSMRMDGADETSGRARGSLNLLEHSVDRMVHRVNDLMTETYTAKVQEREAQLRALQAQINPHFLYNTLDTINWIAVGRGAHDISQMIDSLAKYFRLSLNKGRDTVSVEDELNLAKVYLEIQQSRFIGSFDFTIEADPEALSLLMPKLTLQPIVENALLHGIRKSEAKRGSIRIEARLHGDELLLSVGDDGLGMPEEQALRLLTEPRPQAHDAGSGSSYGLYNVNERIRLFSGEAYGLSIRSRPGEGTTVRVRLKARLEPPEPPAQPT